MDLIVDEVGEIVVNNVHVGAGAQASRRGARWKDRLGSIGVGKVNLGKLGYPIGAAAGRVQPADLRLRVEVDGEVVNDLDQPVLMVAVGNGANVGGGTELDPGRRPRGRPGRRDDLPRRSARSPGSATPCDLGSRRAPPSATTSTTCAARRCRSPARSSGVSADGEIYGPERQRTWHVEPAAYSHGAARR